MSKLTLARIAKADRSEGLGGRLPLANRPDPLLCRQTFMPFHLRLSLLPPASASSLLSARRQANLLSSSAHRKAEKDSIEYVT
jgi:hypothetical protein